MRFLTYNVGLLDLRLFGRSLLRPAGWIPERFDRLADSILALDPDIVTLQEIYERHHKETLAARVAAAYPYAAISPACWPSIVPASLLTLSKWPMRDLGFTRFRIMPMAEKLIDNKGFQLCSISSPSGDVLVANVHTTAGGRLHPEDPKSDRYRDRQLDELLAACASSAPVVLAGDFNCGSVSPGNYRRLLDAGYSDAWTTANGRDLGWTWEPTSSLNAGGTHSVWGCPAQRIDLVLLNASAAWSWVVEDAQRVFAEPSVSVATGQTVTLSDHYGVLVTLAPTGARPSDASAHVNPSPRMMNPS
jgi:endonuclease/exonuclease/phosphatase family metal-dependent hydrolase